MKAYPPTLMNTIRIIDVNHVFNKTSVEEAIEHHLLEGSRGIIINLEYVKMIDSVGLGALVGFNKQLKLQGVTLVLCGLTANLQKLVTLTKLDHLLTISTDTETALQYLQQTLDDA